FDGATAVGFDGVHVNVAANVVLLNQTGENMSLRRLDLATVLPELGDDVIEPQLGINLFFVGSCNADVVRETAQSIFAQRVSHPQCTLTDRDIVVLRTGEILQCGSK